MTLLTQDQLTQLIANGAATEAALAAHQDPPDHKPVVKLFTPDGACTWLLSEVDPEAPDIAFGLCDLGMGCPELGSVSLAELGTVRGRLRLPIERDLWFEARCSITVYARAAWRAGRITEQASDLEAAAEPKAA